MTKKEKYHKHFEKNPKQKEVLQLYCDGHDCEEIRKIRGRSLSTVRGQAEAIKKILEVNTMIRAVALGILYEIIVVRFVDE